MNKNEDIVAGRLDGAIRTHSESGDGAGKSGSYGKDRLGITSDVEPEGAAGPQAAEASGVSAIATASGAAVGLANRLRSLRSSRGAMILAGGGIALAAVVMWLYFSGGDNAAGPQTASAAKSPPASEIVTPPVHVAKQPKVAKKQPPAVKIVPYVSPKRRPTGKFALAAAKGAWKRLHNLADSFPPPAPARPQAPPQAASAEPVLRYRECPAGFVLKGILRRSNGDLANVNDCYVSVGDTVDDATVVKINELSVEMEIDGERFLVGFSFSAKKK